VDWRFCFGNFSPSLPYNCSFSPDGCKSRMDRDSLRLSRQNRMDKLQRNVPGSLRSSGLPAAAGAPPVCFAEIPATHQGTALHCAPVRSLPAEESYLRLPEQCFLVYFDLRCIFTIEFKITLYEKGSNICQSIG
jgi:hypothetical protein